MMASIGLALIIVPLIAVLYIAFWNDGQDHVKPRN